MKFSIRTLASLLVLAFFVLLLALFPHIVFVLCTRWIFCLQFCILVLSIPRVFWGKNSGIWVFSAYIVSLLRKYKIFDKCADYDKNNWFAVLIYALFIFILSLAPEDFYQNAFIGIFSGLCCTCMLVYLQYKYERHIFCNKVINFFSGLNLFYASLNEHIKNFGILSSNIDSGEMYINEIIIKSDSLNNYIKMILDENVKLDSLLRTYDDTAIMNNSSRERIENSSMGKYVKAVLVSYVSMSTDESRLNNVKELMAINADIFTKLLDMQNSPVDARDIMLQFVRTTGEHYKKSSAVHVKSEIDKFFERMQNFGAYNIESMDKFKSAMSEFIQLHRNDI